MSKYAEVEKIILSNFSKSRIIFIKEFLEGYNNVAYDVKLDSGNYVIKIIKIKGYETYVLKQNKLRKLIRKKFKNFPIARILKSDYGKKIIDRPYIIAEKLDGESLRKAYKKIKNKAELFEEVGELYGKIHSFKMKTYGELDSNLKIIHAYKSWYIENCRKIEKTFKKLEKNKLLSLKMLELNNEFFKRNKHLLKKEIGPRLCHGDASLTNILVKKDDGKYVVSGIIDFEFSRASGITQELFSGLRIPDRKYLHRNSLIKGYCKWNQLPNVWDELIHFYKWMSHLDRLSRIKGMSWRNLNKGQTIERKKNMRAESLSNLRKILKKFEI